MMLARDGFIKVLTYVNYINLFTKDQKQTRNFNNEIEATWIQLSKTGEKNFMTLIDQ